MKHCILFFLLLCIWHSGYAQRNCGTAPYTEGVVKGNRSLIGRYGAEPSRDSALSQLRTFNDEIIIPLVFHIVYNTDAQKISKELISKQVDMLNNDFSGRNALIERIPGSYRALVADCRIRFVIDTICYISTNVKKFRVCTNCTSGYSSSDEPIKFSANGGHDGFPSTEFLNVWVGNITDGSPQQLLGYATFPGGDNRFDGVVIYYNAFGPQNVMPRFNKGRTLTHEIGHWLNLRHIWGDDECGNDHVDDTPPQKTYNAGCPLCPKISCNPPNEPDGDMLMNYMDYVDDTCMFMFSDGQKQRMRSLFLPGSARASFIHGVEKNSQIFAKNNRQDSSASTILAVVETGNSVNVHWDTVANARAYKVLAKKINDPSWIETTTVSNEATFSGLEKSQLYELKVQTISQDGEIESESTPFLFTATKQQGGHSRKLHVK